MKKKRALFFTVVLVIGLFVIGACNIPQYLPTLVTAPDHKPATPTAETSQPSIVPTPEPFWVEPPTSPTDALTQDLVVYIGNGEEVTVITESGEFTAKGNFNAYGNPAVVTITLLPDTVHYLKVIAKVKADQQCSGTDCGGYTLSTTLDRNGNPLVIVQGSPKMRLPHDVITAENAGSLSLLGTIQIQNGYAECVDFLKEGKIVTVGNHRGISLWNLTDGSLERIMGENTSFQAQAIAVRADQTLLATGGRRDDPAVQIWVIPTDEGVLLGKHESQIESLAFSPDGSLLASGGSDDTVMVWDLQSGEMIARLTGDDPTFIQDFQGLFWQDNQILSAIGTTAIYWWNISNQQLIKRIEKPEDTPFLVHGAFRPDGKQIAAAAQDRYLYLWETDTGEWRKLPAESDISLNIAAYSPDNDLVAAASYNRVLVVWNITDGSVLAQLPFQSDSINALRFSPDGRYLVAAGWQGPLWVWGIR